jgi:lipoprotein-anchoring transpeptidase ErfK/SrfK
MADYYAVMLGAVGKLDPNTVEARRHTYDRARRAMRDRLQGVEPRLPRPVIDAELKAFDQAIERVEAQYGDAVAAARAPAGRIFGPLMTALAVAGVVIAVGLASIIFGPRISREKQTAQADTSTPGVSYVYLKQPVYYRTTHPAGTIVVDKAQRFIYVVLPNVVALRYGMGVGPECANAAGLYRISRKEEWPGRSNSAFGQLRNMFGGDPADNPLGPRALYFGTDYRLHGTNAPANIGGSMPLGCIALLNESITEFYDKAPVETRVVVLD